MGGSTANVWIKIMVSTLVSLQRNVCGPLCPQRLCASYGQTFCPKKRCLTKSDGRFDGLQASACRLLVPPTDFLLF